MNAHAHIRVVSAEPIAELRPSIRVAKLADAWDSDVSQIRRLVDAGELEAHGVGTRGMRVYIDSANDYQARHSVAAKAAKEPKRPSRRPVNPGDNAAHRAALATLRRQGIG